MAKVLLMTCKLNLQVATAHSETFQLETRAWCGDGNMRIQFTTFILR